MYEYSFYVVYILLLTTGTITFIEALRTKDQTVRNVLNLETCISIVAAYFYSLFIARMTAGDKEDVIHLRYVDWSVTTPMLLLSLILTTLYSTGGGMIHLSDFFIIVCCYSDIWVKLDIWINLLQILSDSYSLQDCSDSFIKPI